MDINPDILAAGIKDAISGKPQLTTDQVKEIMAQFEKDMEQKQKQLGEKNKTDGTKFLEDNKKSEGVQTTKSGLQYKVISAGKGTKSPLATDKVTVHYTGKLIDGTVFDSSSGRDPITFEVGGVIAGWTEALQLMKEGDKWMIYLPYDIAYGERGAGDQIPPYATLIFEVELIKVN